MKDNRSISRRIKDGLRDMAYVWWLEMKNTVRDEGMLIFFILVPLGYPLLYSWIYNNEVVRDVPVAVVDMDHSPKSREFIEKFDGGSDTRVAFYCNNLEEARDLVGKQAVHGVLYFPEGFDEQIGRGDQGKVSVYCDMSLMLTYKAIYQTAQAVSLDMGSKLQAPRSMSVTKRDAEVSTKPLAVSSVAIYNATGGYGNAILPGVLMLIIQQTLLLGIGLSAGTARENNRYEDLVPISHHYNGIFKIVTGKSLCYFMIYLVMGSYITMAVPRFFSFTSLVGRFDLVVFLIPYLLACIFFGMMLSCLVRYRENVMLLVVFTSVPFLFMSGISWPQSNIPGVWQAVGSLVPSTFGIRGFLKLSSMGASMNDVTIEYRNLWLQAVIYFFATCVVYQKQLEDAKQHALTRLRTVQQKIESIRKRRKIMSEE